MTEPVYDQQDVDNYYLAVENRKLKKELDEMRAALREMSEQLNRVLVDEETERTTDDDYDPKLAYRAKLAVIQVAQVVADRLARLGENK